MNRSTIALAVALTVSPAFAGQDYPPGLFENSPVVPSGPPVAAVPSGPADADVPFGPTNEDGPLEPPDAVEPIGPPDVVGPEDYCASIAFRTFRSLAEVRQAHALCDHRREPPSRAAGDQPSEWMR
jgi:hypothetical protein